MNMKHLALLLALIIPATTIPLPLPNSIASKAVYYQHSWQLPAFSCGYNACFNACNLETANGLYNPYSDYSSFESLAAPYAEAYGFDPHGALYDEDLQNFADILSMKKFVNLSLKKEQIVPLIDHSNVVVYYNRGTPQWEINRALKLATEEHDERFMRNIDQKLLNNRHNTQMVHFGCFIKSGGVGHIVLVSLVQNSTGRGLYVFDNMNAEITEDSDIKYFIDYLTILFDVSPKNQFKGSQLPDHWATAPSYRHHH